MDTLTRAWLVISQLKVTFLLLPPLPPSSYTPQDVYKVVAAVNSYKLFLPWCKDSLYLRETEQKSMVRLVVGFPPLLETYTALVLADPPNSLRVSIRSPHSVALLQSDTPLLPSDHLNRRPTLLSLGKLVAVQKRP